MSVNAMPIHSVCFETFQSINRSLTHVHVQIGKCHRLHSYFDISTKHVKSCSYHIFYYLTYIWEGERGWWWSSW